MATPHDDFLAFLQARRSAYRAELPGKVAAIDALWSVVRQGRDEPGRVELERAAHSLAGTAGTFGFDAVSEAGRAMEAVAGRLAAADDAARAELERQFDAALLAAHRAVDGPAAC